jgi:peroxiredoxin
VQRSRLVSRLALASLLLTCLALPSPRALARSAHERPLPAFEGVTLQGERVAISDYIGRRLLLVFFNPDVPSSVPAVAAAQTVSSLSTSHNFAVLGIAVGSTRANTRDFVQQQHLSFPIIDDSSGRITQRLGLQSQVTIVAADAEGYLIYGTSAFSATRKDEAERVEDDVRTALRLPGRTTDARAFGEKPVAPLFETVRLDGGQPFRLADHAGRPVVLIFFLHTCPHCHHALDFLAPEIAKIPEARRPLLVAVSILDRPSAVRAMLAERKLDIPEVLLDPAQKLQNLYQLRGGVPDIFFLDGERRIVHRVQGWRDVRDPALARMTIAKISGEKVPFLLNPKGYTGSDVCGVCHELELESWHYTQHANAYDTLVTHGSERDPECVSCHVVGFDEPGGYTIAEAPAHLEDVSCESCHGRGGPHLSKGFIKDGNYEPVCKTCHNPTHSLGFDYDSFRKNISHIGIAGMTPAQREALGGSRPGDLMPTDVAYVGSDACKSCHEAEFATWEQSPHGHSLRSLEARDKTTDASCLACHTTAFDLPGGFPAAAASNPKSQPDLARVGCESCHGPGEAHVGPNAKRRGTIISLGDKCDSCVILQICGSCHDDDNDPGFAFEVLDKIEKQRHGTIEAGTGKPISETGARKGAHSDPTGLRDEQLAARALRQLGR